MTTWKIVERKECLEIQNAWGAAVAYVPFTDDPSAREAIQNATLIAAAPAMLEALKLIAHGSRAALIDWLFAADPNGVWTNEDSAANDLAPITLAAACAKVAELITRD